MNIVTANVLSATGPTGEAPQLSGTYAQYDNGSLVFNKYWNFAGTSTPTGITPEVNIVDNPPASGSVTFNNGALITQTNNWGTFIVTSSTVSAGNVAESYLQQQTNPTEPGDEAMLAGIVTSTSQTLANTVSYAGTLDADVPPTMNSTEYIEFQDQYKQTAYPYPLLAQITTTDPNASFNIWSLGINPSGNLGFGDFNYTQETGTSSAAGSGALSNFYIALQTTQLKAFFQWLRTRTYPPGGVMPTVAFSAETCP
jgi:hypothetical protein